MCPARRVAEGQGCSLGDCAGAADILEETAKSRFVVSKQVKEYLDRVLEMIREHE